MAKMSRTQALNLTGQNPIRKAVYAGSFDPLTNGHMYMIREGAQLFDQLVVALGDNPGKKYSFSVDTRMKFLKECTKDIPQIQLAQFVGRYLVEFAKSVGASYIIRGIRNPNDYEYEKTMRNINGDIQPNITTIFLFPPREYCEISSSFVKGLVGPSGWEEIVKSYLPQPVYSHFIKHVNQNSSDGTDSGGLKDMTDRG